jgi:sugar fermentation stimulation protein A
MKFRSPLIAGTIVKRYRRSLADVRLDNGNLVTVHSPALGPMMGCYRPGMPVLLSDSQDASRKHALTWELISIDDTWIGINPSVARRVLQESIESGKIPSLASYQIQRETRYGLNRRTDLILQGMENNCFINAYSVSWVENGEALFPEAPNPRVCDQITELADITAQGHRAMVFLFVQRGDAVRLRLAEDIDQTIPGALLDARTAGVEIVAYRARITREEIELGDQIEIVFSGGSG